MSVLPPHSRCYARITAFELACPWCGTLLVVAPKSPHARHWDRYAQAILCPALGCRRRLAVGLLVYSPLAREVGHPAGPAARGSDQVPTRRQIAEGRALRAGGYWLRAKQLARAPRNLVITETCSCAPLPWQADCPVHGAERADGSETGAQDQPVKAARPATAKQLAARAKFYSARQQYWEARAWARQRQAEAEEAEKQTNTRQPKGANDVPK